MSPTIPPDPDMRVADSDTAAQAQRTRQALETQATEVRKQADALAATNSGRGIDRGFEKLVQLEQKLKRMADQAYLDQQLAEAMGRAAQQFRSTAPTVEEVQAALDEWERLSAQLMTPSGVGAGVNRAALQKQVNTAGDNYEMLLEQRKAAITAHNEAVENAMARHAAGGSTRGSTPAPSPNTPGAPRTPGPAPAAPPGTGLSAGQTPEQARAVADLLSRQSGQPAQLPPQTSPAAGQAPAAAAGPLTSPAGGGQRGADRRKPFDTGDLERGIGPVAALPVMPPPPRMSAVTPPPPPTVTGTSTPGLVTNSDTSGRAGPPRTAFSPATNLSAAGAATESAPLHRSGAGYAPMGHGMAPMMGGGLGAPGGGAPKKEGEQITAYDGEQALLHGHEVLADAVPGGTIAQNRGDSSA